MAKFTLKCARCGEIFDSLRAMVAHDKECKEATERAKMSQNSENTLLIAPRTRETL